MRSRFLPIALLALLPATAPAWGDECKLTAQRTAGIDTQGAEQIVIRAGAGDLSVKGKSGTTRIEARGRACTNKEELLDQIQLSVRREGNEILVETTLPQRNDGSWKWGSRYAYLDVELTLPSDLPVRAIDSSGDATFSGLASLEVEDSSGDLDIERIAGELVVGDSSGDIEIEGAGSLRLRDSSGDVDVEDVRGNVLVVVDSSGDLHISRVGGNVDIEQDSSGSIRVEDVKGSVKVGSDGSGDIYANRVGGDFTVGSDSSGSVEHHAVSGNVSLPPR